MTAPRWPLSERRHGGPGLDRSAPAAPTTSHDDQGRTLYWVRAGSTEVPAWDAADQRRIIAIHNVLIGAGSEMDGLRRELRVPSPTAGGAA